MTRSSSELDPAPVASTIALLARRIQERFPGSSLSEVAADLVRLADQNQAIIEHLRRPPWWLRVLAAAAIRALIALSVWAAVELTRIAKGGSESLADLLQGIDAATNELI